MPALLLFLLMAPQGAPEILENSCVRCHTPEKRKGGLDLTTRETLLKGGDSGPAAVPGRSKESLLYKLVARLDEPYMPKKGEKLPDAAIAALAAWIDAGAKYERPLEAKGTGELHWAFTPLRKTTGAPIDDFIRKALAARGLAMNPEAPRATLIRRLTFDLTGLPPTPDEIEAALAGTYEGLVDRLLADPHYGERWGRHWLDVARYADSSGYESDYDQKTAHPYRDFVIRALNEDLPFDTFVRWQLAGDELEPDNPQAVAATGFCTVGPYLKTLPTDTKRNKQIYRNDELDDIVSTTSAALLGLTLGCARCHDHKYDPIPSKDYYRLSAVFAPSRRGDRSLSGPRRRLDEWREARRTALRDAKIAALPLTDEEKEILRVPQDGNIVSSPKLHKQYDAGIAVTDDDLRASLSDDEKAAWGRLDREAGGKAPLALTLADAPGPPEKHWWLGRGDPDLRKEEVQPGFLTALAPDSSGWFARPPDGVTTFRRSALAAWITDVDRGGGRLLARVIANRLWHHHFGEGIVRTPSDFGSQGDPPSHPELLDELASRLIAGGWRLKALHKAILMSDVYRQDTTFDVARAKLDPDNRLLWRRRPQRLEAESLRDALLAVSGRLNREMYGPAVKLPIPADAIATRSKDDYPKKIEDGPATWRRTIYAFVKRSVMNPMMEVNDAADTSASCGRRARTTVSPQALMLLNDPFVRGCARDLAKRAGDDPAKAYLLALGRAPREAELTAARRYLADQDPLTFVDFCHTLLTLNEFLYVD